MACAMQAIAGGQSWVSWPMNQKSNSAKAMLGNYEEKWWDVGRACGLPLLISGFEIALLHVLCTMITTPFLAIILSLSLHSRGQKCCSVVQCRGCARRLGIPWGSLAPDLRGLKEATGFRLKNIRSPFGDEK